MTRDDVIRMARGAHHALVTKDYPGHFGQLDPWTMQLLERFAKLVAAHEREACAKLADYYDDVIIANAIRARGEKA